MEEVPFSSFFMQVKFLLFFLALKGLFPDFTWRVYRKKIKTRKINRNSELEKVSWIPPVKPVNSPFKWKFNFTAD